MIKINLKLFVTLQKYLPEFSEQFKIPKKTTIDKLIKILGIPKNMVKIIFINGIQKKTDYILKNNDRVGMFPPVGGG